MRKILVADDSVTIQKVIALTFADEPFEILSVGTGAEALEKAKDWRPDIILADVIMPQMNGYELCRAIKQQEGTKGTPVLLLAGTFEAFDQAEAKASGADDFITKPFESAELIEKVKTLVQGPAAAPGAPLSQPSAPRPAAQPSAPIRPPAAPAQPAAPFRPPVAPAPPAAPVRPTAPLQPAAPSAQARPPVAPAAPVRPPAQASTPVRPSAPAASPSAPASRPPFGGGPSSADRAPEPDIWDILSDMGAEASGSEPAAPSLSTLQDAGVVDVGSFEVGLDRIEPPPAAASAPPVAQQARPMAPAPPPVMPQARPSAPAPPPVMPQARPSAPAPPPVMPQARPSAPPAAPVAQQPPMAGRPPAGPTPAPPVSPSGGRVESRERDFFGFDTDFIEASGGPKGVEPPLEVSFDIEEPASPMPAPQASFIVPEPSLVGYPTPETALTSDDFSPALAESPPGAMELSGVEELPFDVADLPPLPEPSPFGEAQFSLEAAPAAPKPRPAPVPPAQPVRVPPPAAPAAGPPAAAALGAIGNVDPAVRKIIEEKVEKIVWEVVPEMAEILIREAIEKIRSGG